jgi:hypothetical protein
MKTRLNIEVEELAESLANTDDIEMGKFLNVFFKALRVNCGSSYNFDMQLHAINRQLNARSLESMKIVTFED